MIEIVPVKISEHFDETRRLSAMHWQETESDFSDRPPELDIKTYQILEEQGGIIAFAAIVDGEIVGYVSGFLSRHPHYDQLIAQHDLLFIHPSHRKGRAGLKLMREFEATAKAAGAKKVLYHAKPNSNFAKLLERLQFQQEEIIFQKGL
ncbi:hypothetical protein HMPREF3136_08975 [Neisseria sp. HMSC15C08]|nr:hypothetical protein HMPREF3136_08975 [Neisseria sp. HMSC15C08]